jgi:hypothetical protein
MTTPACRHRCCRQPRHPQLSGAHHESPDRPNTALTDLIKTAIASRAKTHRLIALLAAMAALLLVLLAVIVTTTILIGPEAAVVAGGVPLGSAAVGAACRYLRSR